MPSTADRSMTSAEALMWGIERDPWMSPNGGSLTLFDRPVDPARFRNLMTVAVAQVPRLRQRVVEPATALGMPHWEDDRDLDLDWHVRRIGAPGDGTLRELLDWFGVWLQDPYDRSRPLWQYLLIDGVEGGRGALAVKIHHVVTDGKGAVRLATAYTALERDAPDPPAVDLDALLAALPHDRHTPADQMRGTVSAALRLPMGATRMVADALSHPERLGDARRRIDDLAHTASDQLHGAGSPLWRERSRRRHLEALSLPFDALHDAAKALGGTVNDVFVTGAIEGAARYHRAFGAPLEHLHVSFVVATGDGAASSHNAFTPVPFDVPMATRSLAERFTSVRDLMQRKRAEVHGGGPLADVAAVANLLPASVAAGIARSQAGHIDFATSNLPGPLGESFVAGARTEHTYVFGPVAGTAFNLTAYSVAGRLDLGIHLDGRAVREPERLRAEMEAAYADLLALAGPPGRPRRRARS